MIKANHKYFINLFFEKYIQFKFKRNFNSLKINNKIKTQNLPVFVIANHISWWDGFWILLLNKKTWRKKIHVMMLEEELKKNLILNKAGAYSINPNSKDAINSLKYTAEILQNSCNLVVMYPQGVMNSLYNNNFKFNKGIEFVLKKIKNNIQFVFAAFFIDYFENPKPTLYCYLKNAYWKKLSYLQIQHNYNQFYLECLNSQISLQK